MEQRGKFRYRSPFEATRSSFIHLLMKKRAEETLPLFYKYIIFIPLYNSTIFHYFVLFVFFVLYILFLNVHIFYIFLTFFFLIHDTHLECIYIYIVPSIWCYGDGTRRIRQRFCIYTIFLAIIRIRPYPSWQELTGWTLQLFWLHGEKC